MSPTIAGAGSPFAEGLKKLQGMALSDSVHVSSSRPIELVMSLPLDWWRWVKEQMMPYTLVFSSCTRRLSRLVYTYDGLPAWVRAGVAWNIGREHASIRLSG